MRLGQLVLLGMLVSACDDASPVLCGVHIEGRPAWERTGDELLSVELPDFAGTLDREAESRYLNGGSVVSSDIRLRYLYGSPFIQGLQEVELGTNHIEVLDYAICAEQVDRSSRVVTWRLREFSEWTGLPLAIDGLYVGAEWDEATGHPPRVGAHDKLSVSIWVRDSSHLSTALRILSSVRVVRPQTQ